MTRLILPDGKEYKGKTHRMPDGALHTGARHTKYSEDVLEMDKPKKSVNITRKDLKGKPIHTMSVRQLRAYARKVGIRAHGRKADLISRLKKYEDEVRYNPHSNPAPGRKGGFPVSTRGLEGRDIVFGFIEHPKTHYMHRAPEADPITAKDPYMQLDLIPEQDIDKTQYVPRTPKLFGLTSRNIRYAPETIKFLLDVGLINPVNNSVKVGREAFNIMKAIQWKQVPSEIRKDVTKIYSSAQARGKARLNKFKLPAFDGPDSPFSHLPAIRKLLRKAANVGKDVVYDYYSFK